MNNKEFDKNIKDKLENLAPNSPQNDWDDFSKMLSQEEGFEDILFDEMVSDSLQNHTSKFNSLHWILLKNRLEKEAKLRKEIFITKTMESLLILLLLITYFNLTKHLKILDRDTVAQVEYAAVVGESDLLHSINQQTPPSVLPQVIGITHDDTTIHFKSHNRVALNQLELLPTIKQELNVKVQDVNPIVISFEQGRSSDGNGLVNTLYPIASLPNDGLVSDEVFQLEEVYPSFYMEEDNKVNTQHAITASFNSNFSIVRTPRDYEFTVDPYRNYNLDFGTGIEYSNQRNNTELAVGLNYTKIAYEPVKISELSGGFNEEIIKNTFDKIEFDLVQIPMNMRYHFNSSKNYHFWAGMGMAMNMSFYSRYNIESEVVAPAPSATTVPSETEFVERQGSRLGEKNFHPGLLEKGSFFDNMFISANVDVGLEAAVTDKVSLHTSVGYYKALTALGLGPNNDVLDAMKVGIGVKYKI